MWTGFEIFINHVRVSKIMSTRKTPDQDGPVLKPRDIHHFGFPCCMIRRRDNYTNLKTRVAVPTILIFEAVHMMDFEHRVVFGTNYVNRDTMRPRFGPIFLVGDEGMVGI